MRILIAGAVVVLSLSLANPARAAGGYEIAFTPFLPVRALLQNYQPMRDYLERELKEPVTFVSAPNYYEDNERIRKRENAFIVAVANTAYLAFADSGYVPMLRPRISTRPMLVVRKDSTFKAIGDLSGKRVAMSDPLAVVSMQGMRMLREAGLSPARDVHMVHFANHTIAVNEVLAGEAGAAIVSDRAVLQMSPAVQAQVRKLVIWDKGALPGIVYLASPNVPAVQRERLSRAIQKFANETAEGRALMEKLGYGGLVPMTAREIKAFEPYGARLRAVLRAG